jgi:hypothetical protein
MPPHNLMGVTLTYSFIFFRDHQIEQQNKYKKEDFTMKSTKTLLMNALVALLLMLSSPMGKTCP